MDGSTASLIAIPIVVTLALAAWLLLVAYAAAHPKWKHGTAAAGPENPAPADDQIHPGETPPRRPSPHSPGRHPGKARQASGLT